MNGGYIDNKPSETLPLPSFMVSESAERLIGDVDNYNDETAAGFRAALEWKPASNVTVTPSVFYQDLEGDAWSVFVKEEGDLVSNFLEISPQKEEFTLYDLTINAELGWADLISTTSYTDYNLQVTEPFDRVLPGALGLPFPYVAPFRTNNDRKVFVEEARLASTNEGKFTWLAGVFYQHQELTNQQRYVAPDINDDLFGGFPAIPDGNLFSFDSDSTEEQLALFGEASYAFTDQLTATVGVRWFDIQSDRYAVADGLFNGGKTITDVSTDENGVTPKFQLSYKPTENSLLYTTLSEGFRPGFGYVLPPSNLCDADLANNGISNPDGQVDSDKLWAYEIGGNTTLSDGKFFISGAAYINKWTDLQQSIELPNCGFTISENAGEAESKGFELEVSATPMDGLNIDLGLGYVDAKLTQGAPGLGAVEGDRLVYVPDWTASLGVTYSWAASDDMEMFVNGHYSYSGDMTFNFDASVPEFYSRDPFSLVGARVGLISEHWKTSLFVDNLFDERPALGNLSFLTSGTLVYTLRPRTIGLSVSYNY
jgi:outer membrane receptor protein involved in Fe transport